MTSKKVSVVITSMVGVLMILDYFLTLPPMNSLAATLRSWGVIVTTFATGLGAINLLVVNSQKLWSPRDVKDRISAFLTLSTLIATGCFGVFFGMSSKPTVFMYDSVVKPASTAMMSLLAMFIASSAYRAFRMRNTESTILLVVASIVLVGQMPAVEALSRDLVKPSEWIMNTFNLAAQRGIIIAAGIAFIGLSLRVIAGLEKGYLGESE